MLRKSAQRAPPLHPITMERVSYLNFPNCLRISNGEAELIVTTDVGPRVLRYALAGGENAFGEYPENKTETSLGAWKPYGGQRLWAWPELFPATYAPDNTPIEHAPAGELGVRLTQPKDASGLTKHMTLMLAPHGSDVEVEYSLVNENLWPIRVAPWTIAILRGGAVVMPREAYQSHDENVGPSQSLGLFHFTDLQDPRYTLGQRYIMLRAEAQYNTPQKIGLHNKRGWCAYLSSTSLLLKHFDYQPGLEYPDYGCNTETYADGDYLEIEVLGPLQTLNPGESATLREKWQLFPGSDVDLKSEDAVHAVLAPRL